MYINNEDDLFPEADFSIVGSGRHSFLLCSKWRLVFDCGLAKILSFSQ